ncbi:hypothetical protein [Amycolatopsis sp. cmx-11-32]|uniref:hypothetical protein n=1 Tax=Amycolatopsis sp. cmx-11-32 TaxID=2785796 RepID=UPI0039E4F30B
MAVVLKFDTGRSKGRSPVAGRANGRRGKLRAKLTKNDVRDILVKYWEECQTLRALAREYGVSTTTIYRTVQGHTWPLEYLRWRREVKAEGRRLPERRDMYNQPVRFTEPCIVELARFELAVNVGEPSPVGSVAEVAARHGVSQSAAYRVLQGTLHATWFDAVYDDLERGGSGRLDD